MVVAVVIVVFMIVVVHFACVFVYILSRPTLLSLHQFAWIVDSSIPFASLATSALVSAVTSLLTSLLACLFACLNAALWLMLLFLLMLLMLSEAVGFTVLVDQFMLRV